MESHLLQMRGLKLAVLYGNLLGPVASFTDAWIETKTGKLDGRLNTSHLLQMRGLKHSRKILAKLRYSRIFYRCVD